MFFSELSCSLGMKKACLGNVFAFFCLCDSNPYFHFLGVIGWSQIENIDFIHGG